MMDTFGQVYLVVVVSFVVALVGFWLLSRYAPRGAVLVVDAVIYFSGLLIAPGQSRYLVGLAGLLRMIGFTGGILGLIDLLRKRKPTPPPPQHNPPDPPLNQPRRVRKTISHHALLLPSPDSKAPSYNIQRSTAVRRGRSASLGRPAIRRHFMSHRWLLPCTLSITCLCGCGGRPADQPSAAPPPFDVVGVWRSLDGQGQVFHITVNADHTASSDWGEGETGRWAGPARTFAVLGQNGESCARLVLRLWLVPKVLQY